MRGIVETRFRLLIGFAMRTPRLATLGLLKVGVSDGLERDFSFEYEPQPQLNSANDNHPDPITT